MCSRSYFLIWWRRFTVLFLCVALHLGDDFRFVRRANQEHTIRCLALELVRHSVTQYLSVIVSTPNIFASEGCNWHQSIEQASEIVFGSTSSRYKLALTSVQDI